MTKGSISNDAAVEEVVKGANAVIECLTAGGPDNTPGTVKRDGLAAIIRAMKKLKVKRLIMLSTGAGLSEIRCSLITFPPQSQESSPFLALPSYIPTPGIGLEE